MGIFDFFKRNRETVDIDVSAINNSAVSLYQNGKFTKMQYGSQSGETSLANIISNPLNTSIQMSSYDKNAIDYACVFAKANTMASLPVKIYTLDAEGNEIEVENQDAMQIIESPNPFTTWYEFIEQQTILLDLAGFVVTEVVYPKSPKEIYSLRSDLIDVDVDREGVKGFFYTIGGKRYWYSARNEDSLAGYAYQIKYFNPTDMNRGHSPYLPAMLQHSIDKHSLQFINSFFANGAHIGGIFESGGNLHKKQLDDLKAQLKENFGSSSKAFKMLVAQTKDAKFHKTQVDPKEADLNPIRDMTRADIITSRGCYPIVLGFLDGASYANANTQWRLYYTNTIKPIAKRLEDTLNNKIFSKYGVLFKFDFSQVAELREDEKDKAETALKYKQSGVMTINEIRDRLGLGTPLDGADELPQPSANPFENMNMDKRDKSVLKAITEVKKSDFLRALNRIKASMENRRARQTRRYFKELEKLVLSNINRFKKAEFGGTVEMAFQGYESILEKYLDIALADNGKDYTTTANLSFRTLTQQDMPENVQRRLLVSEADAIRNELQISGDQITDTTKKQIAIVIRDNRDDIDKMIIAIRSKFTEMSRMTDSRARTIARTEIQSIVQLGSIDGAREGGANHKQWVWSGVEREIHAEINGQVRPIDEPFTSGSGNQLMYPGDPSAPAIDRINCYCDMVFLTLTDEEANGL